MDHLKRVFLLNERFSISGFFNYSENDYRFEPITRQTNFGTLENPQALVVYFDGNEKDNYKTFFNSILLNYEFSENLNLVLEENLNRETQLKSDNMNLNKEIGVNFREINFSYPAWKPNEKIKTEKNIEFLKKEYEKLGEDNFKNKLELDA